MIIIPCIGSILCLFFVYIFLVTNIDTIEMARHINGVVYTTLL